MASLRDVLNHAGRKVRVTSPEGKTREGLAMRRGITVLLEPSLEPRVGDLLEFIESRERFRVLTSEPQQHAGKVDHFRTQLGPG